MLQQNDHFPYSKNNNLDETAQQPWTIFLLCGIIKPQTGDIAAQIKGAIKW